MRFLRSVAGYRTIKRIRSINIKGKKVKLSL
jgi:hypothetical protein